MNPVAPPEVVLDQRMLRALRDYGPVPGKLLHEMLRDFLAEAPSLMADIERFVDEQAYSDAARAGHRLKGSSGHIGAIRLAGVAGDVETSARTGVRQATVAATTTARAELDLAIAAAQAVLCT